MGDTSTTTGTTGYVDVRGARLYYEIMGTGEPLVLLHAGIANLRMWDEQAPAFAERYRVIRYDLRSYGKSSAESSVPWSLREDLRGVLDALEIERAYLLGCSMGGQTIIDFALTAPSRVAALVLVGPGLGGFTDHSEEGERYGKALEAAFQRNDIDEAIVLGTQMWIDGPNRPAMRVNPAMRARAKAMLAETFRSPLISDPTPLDPPAVGRLSEISAPTLIIQGENDIEDIHRICALLAKDIPGARLETIADAAHLPNMDHPDQFNRLVLDFLATL